MSEKKYKVIDSFNHIIADGMTLEMALLFMEAYCNKFYMEEITLTLMEIERTKRSD